MGETKVIGRPREFDEDEALAKILDVFWAKGFEGTSMSDLETATGLRKGSLYAAFGDKRAMYLKALALYGRTAIDDVRACAHWHRRAGATHWQIPPSRRSMPWQSRMIDEAASYATRQLIKRP